MIPESEISEYPELEVKPKIGNIFMNEKILEEHSVKVYKILIFMILIFMSIRKKKYKLIKMDVNKYYLELMFILLNIF